MPATGSRASKAKSIETGSAKEGWSRTKRSKQNTDGGSEPNVTSSQTDSPKRGKKRDTTSAEDNTVPVASSTMTLPTSLKSPEKSKPRAAQARGMRLQKNEKSDSKPSEKQDIEGTSQGTQNDVEESKAELKEGASVFSPRRSGRGVIPNRRFKDMELDLSALGRKRPKEESTDNDAATERAHQ